MVTTQKTVQDRPAGALRTSVRESLGSRGRRVASAMCNAKGGPAWNGRAKEVEAGRMNHGACVHGLEDLEFLLECQ